MCIIRYHRTTTTANLITCEKCIYLDMRMYNLNLGSNRQCSVKTTLFDQIRDLRVRVVLQMLIHEPAGHQCSVYSDNSSSGKYDFIKLCQTKEQHYVFTFIKKKIYTKHIFCMLITIYLDMGIYNIYSVKTSHFD